MLARRVEKYSAVYTEIILFVRTRMVALTITWRPVDVYWLDQDRHLHRACGQCNA